MQIIRQSPAAARIALLALPAAVVLAACSSSGTGTGAGTTAPSTSSAPGSTTASSASSSPDTSMSMSSGESTSGSADTATAKDGKVTIDTTNMLRFVPATVNAKVGKLVVTLTNSGSYPHNISVPQLNVTSKTVGNIGQSSTQVTFNFPKPGTYRFICTYHVSAGMVGKFVVTK